MFNPEHKTHKPKNKNNKNKNKNNNKYLSYGVFNFETSISQTSKNKELNFNNVMVKDSDMNNGLCSPPLLWRTSPTRNNYRNMSPESKAEAVARGQKELMEMVKNMPESCYELTLKDLVEQREKQQEQKSGGGDDDDGVEGLKKVKSFERKSGVKMGENYGGGGGYLLKMGWFPFGSRKAGRTKKNLGMKVSPRPSVDGSGKRTSVDREKEWWKIGFSSEGSRSGSKSSSTGSSSISSSGRSSNKSNRKNSETISCWSFLWTKRSGKGE